MDRDSALETAWDRYNTASPLAGPSDDFTAGWQAALAYVRGERAEARMEDEVQRLHEIADGAHGHNAAVRGAARDRLRTLNVSPPEQD